MAVPPWLPDLPRVVGLLTGDPDTQVVTWTAHPLGGVSRATQRLSGTARTRGGEQHWAVVQKRVPATPDRDPARPGYPWREVLAYRSGYLRGPACGLRAPLCYAETVAEDGAAWLWLEAIGDDGGPWTAARYRLAARHLGLWGADASRRALPDYPWLCRTYHRDRFAEGRPLAETFLWRDDAWTHPTARRLLPGATRERATRIAAGRASLLADLDAGTPTVCHLDAHRLNLLDAGGNETVAIDWASVGIDALGSDAGQLVAGSVLWRQVSADEAPGVLAAVVQGYRDGLRAGGAAPEVDGAVRAALLLRLVCFQLPLMLAGIADMQWRGTVERTFQCDFDTQIERWARAFLRLLDAVGA